MGLFDVFTNSQKKKNEAIKEKYKKHRDESTLKQLNFIDLLKSNHSLNIIADSLDSYIDKITDIIEADTIFLMHLEKDYPSIEGIEALYNQKDTLYQMLRLTLKKTTIYYESIFKKMFDKLEEYPDKINELNSIQDNYGFKFEEFIPYFDSIIKLKEMEKEVSLFDYEDNALFLNSRFELTKTIIDSLDETILITAIGYLCSLREYSQYGFVEIFRKEVCGDIGTLERIINLPVVSKSSIIGNEIVDKRTYNALEKDLVSFLQKILKDPFINKNCSFEHCLDKGLLGVEEARDIGITDKILCLLLDDLLSYIVDKTIEGKSNGNIDNTNDSVTGIDFEHIFSDLLIQNGYNNVEVTTGSGDFGVDVLAYKDKIKYAFQCKYYSGPVGNKAIQEILAGRKHYGAQVGIVVTNNTFTLAAREQADSSGIILWDGNDLEEMFGYDVDNNHSLQNEDSEDENINTGKNAHLEKNDSEVSKSVIGEEEIIIHGIKYLKLVDGKYLDPDERENINYDCIIARGESHNEITFFFKERDNGDSSTTSTNISFYKEKEEYVLDVITYFNVAKDRIIVKAHDLILDDEGEDSKKMMIVINESNFIDDETICKIKAWLG